jgi:hypothetical protein
LDDDEQYCRDNPVEVKDEDLFLHGTSSNNFLNIKSSGFLKQAVSKRNWGNSPKGICFEKYVKGKNDVVLDVVTRWSRIACKKDKSLEGVILQINGVDLKKLGCPILADWNMGYPIKHDEEWIPIGIDSWSAILSIVVECDIPVGYLKVIKRFPYSTK